MYKLKKKSKIKRRQREHKETDLQVYGTHTVSRFLLK
jgi:hypothetical protein